MTPLARVSTILTTALLAGCAARHVDDPSFAVSYDEARDALTTMERSPRPRLARPVVILDGIGSWGSDSAAMRRALAARVDGTVVSVSYPFAASFASCRRQVVAAVARELAAAGEDPAGEVDVIGLSLGGAVARFASIDDDATLGPRLRVARLFTVSSPMSGARMAESFAWLSPLPVHRELRPGSAFYAALRDAPPPAYPVVSYTRLGDRIVGARYASLPGAGVYWLAGRPFENSHFAVMHDPRVIADLLRRLRGEAPFTAAAPSPLPAGFD